MGPHWLQVSCVRQQPNYIFKQHLNQKTVHKTYISWISNYNNLRINYKYAELLILPGASLLIPSLVQSPFPALSAIIFVSILGFVMLLVTITAVAYKVISK